MRSNSEKTVKSFAILFMALLLGLAVCLPAFAADMVTADITVVTDTTNNYTTEVEVFWSDDWFFEPSTEYNHELAITSIALSDAAYLMGEDNLPLPLAVEEALTTFGFDAETVCSYNYDYPYTDEDNDVAACTFAAKATDAGTVIAVVVRGTQIGAEWISNLKISEDPENTEEAVEHYGFTEAEHRLYDDLQEYIASVGGSDEYSAGLKFYVTGHSRGGAVADLLAAALNDEYGKENVYAYTFAAPTVSANATSLGYENIFNIVSMEDIIPQIPFSSWNFLRYGTDLWIPGTGISEGENDMFFAHSAYVYYARMKSGLPDTLFL